MLYQKSKGKQIVSNQDDIKKSVIDTINQMANIVGNTLGPGGRPVLIEREGLSPLVTKDGVTVAKSLGIDNSVQNIIIDSAKEICIKTAREAGDGTTTAIVLGASIVNYGMEYLQDNPKVNPQKFIRELQNVYNNYLVPYLKKHSKSVKNEKEMFNVAKISCNGDAEIAKVVVDAIIAAGDDGTILIEEGKEIKTKVDKVEGFIITSGLKDIGNLGTAFINDNAGQQCKMDQGLVFLYDGSLSDLNALSFVQDALETSGLAGKPLMIFAHEFADNVLGRMAATMKGGMTVVPIKTPRSGLPNSKTILLQDVSAYTGAKIFDPATISKIKSKDFGSFNSAKVNMFETFFIGEPDHKRIEQRIVELKAIESAAISDFDKMFLKSHIAKLTGGVATILVGGSSDLEIREKKDRVEDAVEAVKSAISEGIIPGGCYMHLEFIKYINNHSKKTEIWEVLSKALLKPFELLISNCGEDWSSIWVDLDMRNGSKKNFVYDADAHEIVNAFKAGIIEPTKVCRTSLGNALSVASLLISLGGIIVTPRNAQFEQQLELTNATFKNMLNETQGE